MEEKRDNKEIRVRLHHIDRGNCTEVWEVQTEKGKRCSLRLLRTRLPCEGGPHPHCLRQRLERGVARRNGQGTLS